MQNIEIKARYEDIELGRELALAIGAHYQGELHQTDTYFHARTGRLKLREITGAQSHLISYSRPHQARPKTSFYRIYPLEDAGLMKQMLEESLGIWRVVEKRRDLFLFDEIRIHLDRVQRLGNFLELEGVVSDPRRALEIREKVIKLICHFQISTADLIAGSYSDLN